MPPTNIRCSKPRRPLRSRNRGSQKQWRGSHEGYSGDMECTALSTSEDECSITGQSKSVVSYTTASTSLSSSSRSSVRIRFYGDMPKRRNRDKPEDGEDIKTTPSSSNRSHPEIDLSQVRVISCQEHDLRQWKKNRDFMKRLMHNQDDGQDDPSQSEDSCESSSESSSKEKKLWSGPLAVIDRGSVFGFGEVDTSCSLLNEIYNIGSIRRSSGSNNTCSVQEVYGLSPAVPSSNTLTFPVFSGLKRDAASLNIEKDCKRRKNADVKATLTCSSIEETSFSFEEAVSFSPFARVIFDSQPPHTIVHINAAYGSLVSQGVVEASYVGRPLKGTGDIPTIVANHLQQIASSLPPYQIFPVISSVADYHIFEAYQKLQSYKSSVMASMQPSSFEGFDTEKLDSLGSAMGMESGVTGKEDEKSSTHFISYYVLQIESNSQINQGVCRN